MFLPGNASTVVMMKRKVKTEQRNESKLFESGVSPENIPPRSTAAQPVF